MKSSPIIPSAGTPLNNRLAKVAVYPSPGMGKKDLQGDRCERYDQFAIFSGSVTELQKET
jgi:hypothetical protein